MSKPLSSHSAPSAHEKPFAATPQQPIKEIHSMTQKPALTEKLGMHPQLAIGFLGLLLFMIGDGVESGFLSPYMLDLHFSQNKIALVFTLYGAAAALASWLSRVLSDLLGPKKVMWPPLLT